MSHSPRLNRLLPLQATTTTRKVYFLNIAIGNHRLRSYEAGFVLEYRQKSRMPDDQTRWRARSYPTSLKRGLELLAERELRTSDCENVKQLIKRVDALAVEIRACAQLLGTSNEQSAA